MLQLQNISLTHFRNHAAFHHDFNKNIIGICGANGTGKTNLLDAIYYLSFCKSYFNKSDAGSVTHNLKGFRIAATIQLENKKHTIACIVRENGKKEVLWDNEEYARFSKHIGVMPCVIIAPDDIELITGGSELRRKFIDVILSQTNADYLQLLINYNNILLQRNSLLKKYAVEGSCDEVLLNIYTGQLAETGNSIYTLRKEFLAVFLPVVENNYKNIAQKDNEFLKCNYVSQLHTADMNSLLHKTLQADFSLQRTTSGIHKDDIDFLLNDIKFKTEASQGQRKSLLFALKLAEWSMLKQSKGFSPVLLLDDVFEKLDEHRMGNLLETVSKENDCQIFITDTHKERLQLHLENLNRSFSIIELDADNV